MKFTIDGGGVLDQRRAPPVVRDAIMLLDTLKDGQLLTVASLAAAIGKTTSHTQDNMRHPAMRAHRFKTPSGVVYYGNRATIAEAAKQFGIAA